MFFQYPMRKFHIREIARRLGISAPTVSRLIDPLVKENLLKRNKTAIIDEVSAVRDNDEFKWRKRVYNIASLYESGLVSYITQKRGELTSIVLFGSYATGEDWEESDIDIFVTSPNKAKLDLSKFEKILVRKISIHDTDLKKVSKEFKTNLANGIILRGYLDI